MVDQAIKKYVDSGGALPYAIVTDTGLEGVLAPSEVFILPTGRITEGHFAIVPLQTALDFFYKSIWVNTYDSTNGVQLEEQADGDD